MAEIEAKHIPEALKALRERVIDETLNPYLRRDSASFLRIAEAQQALLREAWDALNLCAKFYSGFAMAKGLPETLARLSQALGEGEKPTQIKRLEASAAEFDSWPEERKAAALLDVERKCHD
jgi:hypothetical protein